MAMLEPVWKFPPTDIDLPSSRVDVWRASLDPPGWRVGRLMCLLSDAERERAGQFHFARDRRRFIVGRGILRIILGRYLATSPVHLDFRYEPAGKPALAAAPAGSGIEFNLSHSGGLILCAVTCQGKIGVDVERVRALADRLAERILSPREQAVFRALPPEQRQPALFCAWTGKEAYLKGCGQGLSRAMGRIDVSLAPFEPARPPTITGDPRAGFGWTLQRLAPAPGYLAAVASVAGDASPLTYWQWPEWR
jgi:4'-phosphopantetheinyl transferase